ncbi:hypothetical protein C8J56DRAFT_885842 [Mycena floridula]|nr:hypothetical protein C8J56DRAFT_885842 [Mycena floridula]
MKYKSLLPVNVEGSTRNELLYNFHEYKGRNFVPEPVHPKIRWNTKSPIGVEAKYEPLMWTRIMPTNNEPLKMPKETVYKPSTGSKHLRTVDDNKKSENAPRAKCAHLLDLVPNQLGLLGFMWDREHHSCAYEALLTILSDLWSQNPPRWAVTFCDMNDYLQVLLQGLGEALIWIVWLQNYFVCHID